MKTIDKTRKQLTIPPKQLTALNTIEKP